MNPRGVRIGTREHVQKSPAGAMCPIPSSGIAASRTALLSRSREPVPAVQRRVLELEENRGFAAAGRARR